MGEIMEIDIKTTSGNIYYILGVFEQLRNELKRSGIDTKEYDKLLKNYKNMKYEDILKEIERITHGTIKIKR